MDNSTPFFIDSHCHIHDSEYFSGEIQRQAYEKAIKANVSMICVGTDAKSSQEAVDFCRTHPRTYPIVGVHPHEAKHGWHDIEKLLANHREEIVGIGEIGLDYHYNNSSREQQLVALEAQLQLAVDYKLPVSFHVRDGFDDFWPLLNNFHELKGVLHSFTDSPTNLNEGLSRGFYVGLNGISTFTKEAWQREMYANIPLSKILLETDAPFLTPAPFRGSINMPENVRLIAEYWSKKRNIPIFDVAEVTSRNTQELFSI